MDAATTQALLTAAAVKRVIAIRWSSRRLYRRFCTALISAALAVAMRRISGGLIRPLAPAEFVMAVAIAAIAAVGARPSAQSPDDGQWRRRFVRAIRSDGVRYGIATSALILFAAALSLGGSVPAALALACCIIAAEEVFVWRQFFQRGTMPRGSARISPSDSDASTTEKKTRFGNSQNNRSRARSELAAPSGPSLFPPPDVAHASAEMHQQLTRANLADGADRLAGWLQATFEPGERTSTVHVAFCPPFAEPPKVSIRQTSGPATRIKAGQILAHGLRLELKLNFASRASERVLVEFSAESRPTS